MKKETPKAAKTKKIAAKAPAKKKAAAKKAAPSKSPYANSFSLSLKLGERMLNTVGNSIVECLDLLDPGQMKTKGILTVHYGEKSKTTVMRPFQIKQLLKGPLPKQIFEKRMMGLVK